MTPEQWQGIKDQMESLLAVDVSQRPAYIDQIVGNDCDLRRELESLLLSQQRIPEDFLNVPVYSVEAGALSGAPMVGKRLGPYQIVAQIGQGGMGEVYRALRVDDQYQKEAAIKLIRAGRESVFVVARFKNERQILAKLEHSNIARLLDGGSTSEGIPYLVMELIEGESIVQYCDGRALGVIARLQLFLQVCSAVQFAHQRLIIHRDIKPGNILVTTDGIPKLLDFGISRIVGSENESGGFEHTATDLRMLSPAYASPEQIRGEIITIASDVYSLGVVLYELLAGRHPYRTDSSPEQIVHAICESEPEKPSTAVTQRSATDPVGTGEKLSKHLRGDLDNVVLMALRKEPQRRYASVEQFAEDIRRYLGNLPVIARKDTKRYRASKFVLRHKVGVTAAGFVILTVLAAFVLVVRAERTAKRRFDDMRAMANSLIFDVHDSIRDLPGSTPARKAIVERSLQYLNSLARESGGDLTLQRELATAYERVGLIQGHYGRDNLGDTKGSLDSYQKALAIRKAIASKSRDWKDRLALAQAYRFVSELQRAMGNPNGARENSDHAIAISEDLNRAHPNDAQILYEMGCEYRASASDTANRKALAADEAALRIQPDDLPTLDAYAADLYRNGIFLEHTDPQSALPYYQKELEVTQKLTQRSNAVRYTRSLAHAYHDIATIYEDLQNYPRALENNTKYLNILEEITRADPQNATLRQSLAIANANYALDLAKVGNVKPALERSDRAIGIMRPLISSAPDNAGQRHYFAAIVEARGTVLMNVHRPMAALSYFEEARNLYHSLGSSYFAEFDIASAAACSEKMGEAAALSGETQRAAAYFRLALTEVEPMISAQPLSLMALYIAADAYSGLGDLSLIESKRTQGTAASRKTWTEARSWYVKSLDAWHRIDHPIHSIPGSALDVGAPAIVARRLKQCDVALSSSQPN